MYMFFKTRTYKSNFSLVFTAYLHVGRIVLYWKFRE